MKYVITDSCYWLGLVDSSDEHHEKSITISELIQNEYILFPFPCFYEIIKTRFLKNKEMLNKLEILLKKSNIRYIDDTNYKDLALARVYELNKLSYIKHSLTDAVIREMISDIDMRIDYLVTFNVKDFADVCAIKGVEILDE